MSTFPNLGFVWQWSDTYLLCISSPHAKSLHLAVLPDAADVVHLLKDSLGSAAHRHRTEFDETEGNLQNINMSKQLLAQSGIWTSVNDRLQITFGHFLWHLMKPLEQPARTPFGSTLFTCILSSTSIRCFVISIYAGLFCTCYIYCTPVHPGRGIPHLWLLLRLLPVFLL